MFKLINSTNGLIKSKSDTLKYRFLTLDNGLEILLAQDETQPEASETEDEEEEGSRLSACSMCVNAGR